MDTDSQKNATGGLASIVFLLAGLYFLVSNGGFSSVFSIKGFLFLAIGMFIAAVVLGIPLYLLQRGIAKVLVKTVDDPFSDKAVTRMKAMGIGLLVVNIAVVTVATKFAYEWLIR